MLLDSRLSATSIAHPAETVSLITSASKIRTHANDAMSPVLEHAAKVLRLADRGALGAAVIRAAILEAVPTGSAEPFQPEPSLVCRA